MRTQSVLPGQAECPVQGQQQVVVNKPNQTKQSTKYKMTTAVDRPFSRHNSPSMLGCVCQGLGFNPIRNGSPLYKVQKTADSIDYFISDEYILPYFMIAEMPLVTDLPQKYHKCSPERRLFDNHRLNGRWPWYGKAKTTHHASYKLSCWGLAEIAAPYTCVAARGLENVITYLRSKQKLERHHDMINANNAIKRRTKSNYKLTT